MEIDLNCDVGEAFGAWQMGEDATLIPLVSSVNVACGAHAGDPVVMRRTVELAARYGVAVGAHPGYPDLQGFGRRAMPLTPDEIEAWTLTQIGALEGIARSLGVHLQHVKPHGALYNQAADDATLAAAIVAAVARFDPALILMARAGSRMAEIARGQGLRVAEEAFVDRGYDAQGRLLPRGVPGSVLHDATAAGQRAVALARGDAINAGDGTSLVLHADTLCIHSDTEGATAMAQAVRAALDAANITVRPLAQANG